MSSFRYFSTPGGGRACFEVHPTFTCPHNRTLYDWTDPDGTVHVGEPSPQAEFLARHGWESSAIVTSRHVTPAMAEAAAVLGVDAKKLAYLIHRQHGYFASSEDGGRARVGGKLTDRCAACGARMERVGFRCWLERPYTPAEIAESSSLRINERLGSRMMKVVRNVYVDTRKGAREWAYEEHRTALAVAAEA